MTPRLRFPEFQDAGEWELKTLRDIADHLTEKVGTRQFTPVSISAGLGFVSQVEKFGRDISGAQYRNYIYLRQGDFSYNKGFSKHYPQGSVFELKEFGEAAAPSAFVSFRFRSGYVNGFFQPQFERNSHGRELRQFITSGARGDGLLNVSPDEFFSVRLPVPPSTAEQQKIADCLTSLDALIAAEGRTLEALRTHKKGLMQNLFPREGETAPRLRFPEFRDAGEWEERRLGELCSMRAGEFVAASEIADVKGKTMFPCFGGNGLRGYVQSYTHEGSYILIGRQGALCGNVNMTRGKFHATEHAVVTTPNRPVNVGWLYHALGYLNLNRFATGQAQPGLSVAVLNEIELFAPNEAEQQKIAECLTSLDDLITAQSKTLDALKRHKAGLMQGLFPAAGAE